MLFDLKRKPGRQHNAPQRGIAMPWFQRNWRMLIIVIAGTVLAALSFRRGNLTAVIPLSLIVIGVALNVVAMIANRGKMPADTGEMPVDEPNHQTMNNMTRFRFLCDWIPFAGRLHSPGDVLLYMGILGFVIGRMMWGQS